MKRLRIAVIALFAFVAINSVNAQDENNPWAISFGVNTVDFYTPDASFGDNLKDMLGHSDWNFLPSVSRISAEKYSANGFSLQFAGSINSIDYFNEEDDVDFLYWSIDAIVKYDVNKIFGETGWFDPFVYLGGSYVSMDAEGEGMLNAGVGFNIWFNENLGFNFQHGTKFGFSDHETHFQNAFGLVVKFGGQDTDGDGVYDKDDTCPEVAGLKEFNGCPDADGDGIKDSDDACPNTPGLVAMNGCPDADGDGVADKDDMCANEIGTKANNGCPDTDGDGVVDKDDKCPSASGSSENGGCPWPDTDGDGVLDKDDKCNDKAGPASNSGCPEVVVDPLVKLEEYTKGVLFDTDRASIKDSTAEKLDKVYELISPSKDVIFVIEGYTDNTGDSGYNKYLSKRRAESVKEYLVKKGMQADRLEATGFGDKNPLGDNSTKAGRSENRRVVIKLSDI